MRRAVTALTLLATLAACGERPPTPATLQAVPARMRRAGSAAISVAVSVGAQRQAFTQRGAGVVDFIGKRSRLTLSSGATAGLSPAINIVASGTDVYIRIAPLAAGKWIKIGPGAAGGAAQQGFVTSNPSTFVEYLRGADDVTDLGSDTVQGLKTRHYLAAVDLEKAARRFSPAERPAVRAAIEQLSAAFPMDVWLDGRGLPRRFKVTFSQRGVSVQIQVDMFDFGEPVTVNIPSRNSVVEVNTPQELARLFGAPS